MPKPILFDDDSEEEVELKTENEYAKKYDQWRGKEEIHKLEQKYGTKALNSDASISSDSEDDSDDPPEVSEEAETQFLKTLALLKQKDPRIYDPQFKFFNEKEKEEAKETKEKTLTFAESDDDDDDGNIFSIEKKAEVDDEPKEVQNQAAKTGKDGKLKDYLTGKVAHLDAKAEKDLAPLKALWSDPALNEGEAFLRDYILNQKYLDEGSAGDAEARLRDDAALEEDARLVEGQEQFERAFNFRFEEPDQEYLKRFPRTMSCIRPKDERRSRKRAEVRTRKEAERASKMDDIARLRALKLREIHDKIARIKLVTGNDELAFKDEDIEGDFDPEEHDRRMRAIFDTQFYTQPDDEKPDFPDLDEELEIENWDNFEPGEDEREAQDFGADGPHCEDTEFNMDADYDPTSARANLLEEMKRSLGTKRRNRKNKSKLAKLLSTDKPKFLPEEERSYAQYMEEYYQMDCEDVIGGDLPTRFKYREVVPNDYGLTVEEILLADDKELTQWVPLKKIVRHKPESAQRSELGAYRQRAQDPALKRKLLPSLFKDLPEEPELVVSAEDNNKKKKKKKKKNKQKDREDTEPEHTDAVENTTESEPNGFDDSEQNGSDDAVINEKVVKKKKKDKRKQSDKNNVECALENGENEGTINESKSTLDLTESNDGNTKGANVNESGSTKSATPNESGNKISRRQKKNKKKKQMVVEIVQNAKPSRESQSTLKMGKKRKISENEKQVPNKMKKNNEFKDGKKKWNERKSNNKNKDEKTNKDIKKKQDVDNPLSNISDERLKAYGLNPKKYRGFLKYKKF